MCSGMVTHLVRGVHYFLYDMSHLGLSVMQLTPIVSMLECIVYQQYEGLGWFHISIVR